MSVTINRTKLRPPSRKGRLVERPALLRRLDMRPRPRLALIQAPAGFGKSSLLTQFYHASRACGADAAWLSVDVSDNDSTRFLQHLVAALELIGIPLNGLEAALRSGARLPPVTACDLLSNAVGELDRDVVVCIDDAHLLADATVVQLLAALMRSPSSRLSFVMATRMTPPLPLSSLRLLGELTQIGARDLRFTDAESEAFFATTVCVPIEAHLAVKLNERAEGWVAGLQLASLGLTGGESAAEVIERFSGMNRNVAEFLDTEVLARLDAHSGRFLLETSVLNRMCAQLCNYVTQRNDGRVLLDDFEASNLFLFSLDDERRWYRYHHLLASFLEQRLREIYPDRVLVLHERASVWFEENGCAIEAIEHALRARAFVRAARLLDRLNLFEKGQLALQERLALQIPSAVLEQCPNLQLERIWAWEADWDFAKSRTALQRMKRVLQDWRSGRRAPPQDADLDYIAAKLAHREMMVCLVSDDMAGTRRLCERWLAARHPADLHMQVSTAGALMAARREHYCIDEAAATASALHDAYRKVGFDFGEIFQDCVSGLSVCMQGDAFRAREMYERALRGATALHGRLSPLASMPALLLAEVHYDQGALQEARTLVADYLELAHGLGYVDKLIAGFITRARLEFLDSQPEAALCTLDDAERYAVATGFQRLAAHVLCERLRQLIQLGRREDALDIARRHDLLGGNTRFQPREGVTSHNEILAIAWARAAVLQGELDGAIRLLKNWYRFTAERGCRRSAARLGVELAAALFERHDVSAACHHICGALRHALSGKLIRTFLDGGARVANVLSAATAGAARMRAPERAFATEILAQFAKSADLWAARAQQEVGAIQTAELNRRELDILELAAGDVPNREIARRLALSENTVKWYWKRIFSKLAVRRRLQAINCARAAGVIF